MGYVKLAVVAVILAFVVMAHCLPRMKRYGKGTTLKSLYRHTLSSSNGTNSSSSHHFGPSPGYIEEKTSEIFGLAVNKKVQEMLLGMEFSRIEAKLGELRGMISAMDYKLMSQSSPFIFEQKARNAQYVRDSLAKVLGKNIIYLNKVLRELAFEGELATGYIHPLPRFPPMINANSSSNTNESSNPNNFSSIQRPGFFRFRKSTTQAPVTKTTTAAPAVKDEGKDTARKPIEAVAASISEQSALDETNTKELDVKAVAESILDQYYDEYY